MYIHSVKLINFKSIGDYPESEIIIEPKITAIIGKNESGKSNILDGLSRINFLKNDPKNFSDDILNRNCDQDNENLYIVNLRFNEEEIKDGIDRETKIVISKSKCTVEGGLFDYFIQNNWQFFEGVANFLDEIGTNPFQFKDQDLANYRTFNQEFHQNESLDLYKKINAISFITGKISKCPSEHREELKEKMDRVENNWITLLNMLPVLYYRKNEKHLNTSYKIEEIENQLNSPLAYPNSLLFDFVKVIGVPIDDFILASRTGLGSRQESLRRRINKSIEEKINIPFNQFYDTEVVTLDISFNAGRVMFSVSSEDGESLLLSERSNGLRWYLELFIDAQANNIKSNNTVYLLDEPGVYLHVNAQRELLRLFNDLADNRNQIVYTTHSPYMLDVETGGISRIRAVVKNKEGFTYIYKTAYDSRIAPESQQDTLAPIIRAIGMNLNDTFGPSYGKLNIVTEGMSDYAYLHMMAKELNIDFKKYAIIPAVGASNCVNICAILHGWGCKYIAVFDYDDAGVAAGEKLRKDMLLEYKRQYCFLKDVTQKEINDKTYKTNKCIMEDVVTEDEIKRFYLEKDISPQTGKVVTAKLMSDAVADGSYVIGEECKKNFNDLFKRIISYFEK